MVEHRTSSGSEKADAILALRCLPRPGAGTATLQLQQGVTLTVSGGLTVAANGVLAGNGTVAGNVVNGGLASPGTSPGEIHVAGNLTQSPAGRMLFEIGGTAAGSFDTLTVTQTLTLAGTLDVVLINGFAPQNGDSFDIRRLSRLEFCAASCACL